MWNDCVSATYRLPGRKVTIEVPTYISFFPALFFATKRTCPVQNNWSFNRRLCHASPTGPAPLACNLHGMHHTQPQLCVCGYCEMIDVMFHV
jgi:hypothetical protein